MSSALIGQALFPPPPYPTPDASGASASSASNAAAGSVKVRQINVVIIALLVVLCFVVVFIFLIRARNALARRQRPVPAPFFRPTSVENLRPVGSRGLFVDVTRICANGFSTEEIEREGRVVVYTEAEKHGADKVEVHERECVVCLCEFQPHETLRQLYACDHTFHQECCDAWLQMRKSCPLCRKSLGKERDLEQGMEYAAGEIPEDLGPGSDPSEPTRGWGLASASGVPPGAAGLGSTSGGVQGSTVGASLSVLSLSVLPRQ